MIDRKSFTDRLEVIYRIDRKSSTGPKSVLYSRPLYAYLNRAETQNHRNRKE